MEWVNAILEQICAEEAPLPYLYPTPEGGVRGEWSLGPHEISFEVDIDRHSAEWHRLDTSSNSDDSRTLSMENGGDLKWIADELRRLGTNHE